MLTLVAPTDLAARLAERRKELGISKAEAARQARVTRQTWHAWEHGTATPQDGNYAGIDTALRWGRGGTAAAMRGEEPTPAGESEHNEINATATAYWLYSLFLDDPVQFHAERQRLSRDLPAEVMSRVYQDFQSLASGGWQALRRERA